MRLKKLIALHKQVIHAEWATISISALELEAKWIKAYPYDVLDNVCSDCFSTPDA
jgi:hypothetical protein